MHLTVGNDPVSFREGCNIRRYDFKTEDLIISKNIHDPIFLTFLMRTDYDNVAERHRVVPYAAVRCHAGICTHETDRQIGICTVRGWGED